MSLQQSPLYKDARARDFESRMAGRGDPSSATNAAQPSSPLRSLKRTRMSTTTNTATAAVGSLTRSAPTVSWAATVSNDFELPSSPTTPSLRRPSESVLTDTDIVDECRSLATTDSVLTAASVSMAPTLVAHLRSRIADGGRGFVRHHASLSVTSVAHSTWMESVATEMDDVVDFSDAGTVVGLCDSASIRTVSTLEGSEGRCVLFQCVSSCGSSANLDGCEAVEESLSVSAPEAHAGHRAVSWRRRNESCVTVEEDLATGAC